MTPGELVGRVCRLPADFYTGSKSMMQLVSESGIGACLTLLTVVNITECLAARPDLIEQWLMWSANKRVTSGWYFTREASGFVVGFYPKGEVLAFGEPVAACAEFVVREVGSPVARSPL